jgi:hypothetical protein
MGADPPIRRGIALSTTKRKPTSMSGGEETMPHHPLSPRAPVFLLAILTAFLAALHHLDHIIRANHLGWPVTETVTPFSFSLLAYPLLLGGAWISIRRGVTPWYWVVLSLVLAALVAFVHFSPDPRAEQMKDLYLPYAEPQAYCSGQSAADPPVAPSVLCDPTSPPRPLVGTLVIGEMLALTAVLVALVVASLRELRRA